MRQIFPLILILVFAASFNTAKAVSMGEITGQVIEKETLQPVAFAEIVFENGFDKITITANEYGYYYASHVPTGKYQMRVVFNNRTFSMNKVHVFDTYTTDMNFIVSNNNTLPATVEVVKTEQVFNPLEANKRLYAENTLHEPTRDLSEVLAMTPGVDVKDGKIYIKNSDQVHFFIDGSPVMAPAMVR